MKVTSFYPVWLLEKFTPEMEAHMEAMGMKRLHCNTYPLVERPNGEYEEFSEMVYMNDAGQRIDVSVRKHPDEVEGLFGMRVNVDCFDEGREYFLAKGYAILGNLVVENDSMICALFIHPDKSNPSIYLYQHKK